MFESESSHCEKGARHKNCYRRVVDRGEASLEKEIKKLWCSLGENKMVECLVEQATADSRPTLVKPHVAEALTPQLEGSRGGVGNKNGTIAKGRG